MKRCAVLAVSCFALAAPVQAESLPVWEIGAGFGAYSSPHYLGADQRAHYLLPIPYAIYRGEYLRSDRGGLVGRIYDSLDWDLRLSLGGALPVNSADNDAREGMADLGLILEMGPTLQYTVWQNPQHLLRLDLPLRAGYAFSDSVEYVGLTGNPRAYYRYDLQHWKVTATLGAVVSSRRYHAYFYEVDNDDVREYRPAYHAESGYMGLSSSVGLSRRFGRFYAGVFVRYYQLASAANADSPLLLQEDYVAGGLAMSWIFAQSTRRTTDIDDDQ